MRYVLTGSSGMLGSVLAEELLARGAVRMEPPPGSVPLWCSPSTAEEEPDFRTGAYLDWLRRVDDVEVFVHAGALVGTTRCEANKRDVWTCNAAGPLEIARICARRGIKLVFFASEAEFNPATYDASNPIDVRSQPTDPRTYYGVSKLAGRLLVEEVMPPELLLVLYPCFGFGGARDGTSCVAEVLKCAAGIYDRAPFVPLHPERVKEVTPHALIADLAIRALDAGWDARVGRIPLASGVHLPYLDVVEKILHVVGKPDLSVDWRSDLDYKGDLLYVRETVLDVHARLGVTFDVGDLERAFAAEWSALSKVCAVATHDWSNREKLKGF